MQAMVKDVRVYLLARTDIFEPASVWGAKSRELALVPLCTNPCGQRNVWKVFCMFLASIFEG